ncbi:DUF815 domain-containing protein [Desulfuromonas thiophila]|uniref:DUF815 domain-containing protein n=1 Tax=Desulfuromonas thiophila TaxID=57664 RepID=UPI0029F536D4|nr:DUF815 domain-containing protein [Desulfuromonas thiophila]
MTLSDVEIDWEFLLQRLERLLDLAEERLEQQLQPWQPDAELFARSAAFWFDGEQLRSRPAVIEPEQPLLGLDAVRATLRRNLCQFAAVLPAAAVLLHGPAGGGKRTLVRTLSAELVVQGVRLIELDEDRLPLLDGLLEQLAEVPLQFVVLVAEMPLAQDSPARRILLRLLAGGSGGCPANMLLCVSSSESLVDAEARLPPACDLFGLQLAVPALTMRQYLELVGRLHRYHEIQLDLASVEHLARRLARERGRCSGRLAAQLLAVLAGSEALEQRVRAEKAAALTPG